MRTVLAALFALAFCKGAGAASPEFAQQADSPDEIVPCATSLAPVPIAYVSRIIAMDRKLGLPLTYPITRGMRPVPESDTLVEVGYDVRGRRVRMAPRAAAALEKMIIAAARDGLRLQIVSGFRTVAYQGHLVRGKLRRGLSIEAALRINAAPGFSEHHSGCAVDLTSPDAEPADASFAGTRAYRWLQQHAVEFGFHLSYPPENPRGIEFEPWHWRYVADAARAAPRNTSSPPTSSAMPVSGGAIGVPDSQ